MERSDEIDVNGKEENHRRIKVKALVFCRFGKIRYLLRGVDIPRRTIRQCFIEEHKRRYLERGMNRYLGSSEDGVGRAGALNN